MGKKFTHKIYTILSHRETLKRQENQDTHESQPCFVLLVKGQGFSVQDKIQKK